MRRFMRTAGIVFVVVLALLGLRSLFFPGTQVAAAASSRSSSSSLAQATVAIGDDAAPTGGGSVPDDSPGGKAWQWVQNITHPQPAPPASSPVVVAPIAALKEVVWQGENAFCPYCRRIVAWNTTACGSCGKDYTWVVGTCPTCNGEGVFTCSTAVVAKLNPLTGYRIFPGGCDGTGKYRYHKFASQELDDPAKCAACSGTGHITCPTCHGAKVLGGQSGD